MASHDAVLLLTDAGEVAGMFGRLFQPFGETYELSIVASQDMGNAYLHEPGEYSDRKQHLTPKLLILDLKSPSDGFKVLERVRSQRQFDDMPVVVLAEPNEAQQVSRGYQMGANSFLTKPPAFGELRAVLQALRSQQAEEADIADDEAPMVLVKSEAMGLRAAFEATGVPSPIKTLEDIQSAKAHLENQAVKRQLPLFVDLDLGEEAFELIEWATRNARLAGSRIIVLCRPGDIKSVSRAADSGAELFIVKPVTAQKLSRLGDGLPAAWNEATSRPNHRRDEPDQAMAEGEEVPQNRDHDAATINLSGPRILYVAGNPADCHLFSTAMSQGSVAFTVEFLQGFAEVVEYMRHRGERRRITSASPSCLLLDSATVGEASCEILRWIRNQSSFPDVVVVMFSDTDDANMVKSMYRAGADYYLVKPKSFAGLLSIASIIDSGLRQIPEEFDGFARLPEYRDRFGNPPNPDPAGVQCAE